MVHFVRWVMKFTLETPEYADIWWLLMLLSPPFSAAALCQTVWSVPACLFWVLFTLQAVCLLPLSRQPGFTQQHELLCAEERPSSVNTWLSLHVHSHLIMGEAPTSEWFQYVGEAQQGKGYPFYSKDHNGNSILNKILYILYNIISKICTTISQEFQIKCDLKK